MLINISQHIWKYSYFFKYFWRKNHRCKKSAQFFLAFVEQNKTTLIDIAKTAPKVWIYNAPPVSTVSSFSWSNCMFIVARIISKRAIIKYCITDNVPTTHPKVIDTEHEMNIALFIKKPINYYMSLIYQNQAVNPAAWFWYMGVCYFYGCRIHETVKGVLLRKWQEWLRAYDGLIQNAK